MEFGPDCRRRLRKDGVLEAAGRSRVDALAAVTSVAAELLGMNQVVGIGAPGGRADLVFVNGAADTGVLSVVRVRRVMLHGRTVILDGRPAVGVAHSFRENSLSFFGYPYWDPLLSYLIGLSVTDYDFLRSGVRSGQTRSSASATCGRRTLCWHRPARYPGPR